MNSNDFDVNYLSNILSNPNNNIKIRMDSLFKLRTNGSFDAVLALENALITEPNSDLLRHEVCYCLGQMDATEENKIEIQRFLYSEIFDNPKKYNPIVLHEAAEALGNLDFKNNIELLEKFLDYEDDIIKETCEIAVANIKWMETTNKGQTEGLDKSTLFYKTNDPAPPFNRQTKEYSNLDQIEEILFNKEESLFNQYRAIFTLREFNNESAVALLCKTFQKEFGFSALFKHEVAFILGQMSLNAKSALIALENVLVDESEDPIVRHETALALGEITKSKELLLKYSENSNQLIRESCIIATDFVDYWNEMSES